MKKAFLVIALAMTSSTAALAGDCSNIMGDYQCSFQGQQIPLSIGSTQLNTVYITVNGEGGTMVVDGAQHKSTGDDSNYIATCSPENGLLVTNTFKAIKQSVSIKPTEKGVSYVIDQGDRVISLECVK
jgi:hypothetical protein